MSAITFKRDTSFRKELFTADHFAHPAKMDAQLLIWIVEHYTKVGETILDPMAGCGTTMLACSSGRNTILVELEQKFVDMQKANWNKVRMMPQLGCQMGECQIIQGDARNLENILVDHAIFSPPYAAAQSGGGIAQEGYTKDYQKDKIGGGNLDPVGKRSYMPENTGSHPDNIQTLPYGDIASIITSPPYWDNKSDWDRKSHAALEGEQVTYSDEVGKGARANIGNIHYYDSAEPLSGKYSRAKPDAETYLSAMLQVYQQCHKVLKPQGLLILVTKNFIRNKKEIRLDEDTMRLCEQAGFQFMERHYRKLPAQSFWRVIYRQKYPEAPVLDKEDILVFVRKQP